MVFYIDLKLLPDEEVPIFFIRNKVYTKLVTDEGYSRKVTDEGYS